MKEIFVNVCGDHWANPQQVQDQLIGTDPTELVYLDINTEGPCLSTLGIIDTVKQCCAQTGRDLKSIVIDNWHNTIEDIEFQRRHRPRISHFFWMSNSYRHTQQQASTHQYLVSLFVGRATLSRAVMLYDVNKMFGDQALLSLMSGHGFKLDQDPGLDFDFDQTTKFKTWWTNSKVVSLDNHAVQDQYNSLHNTNQDLLKFYHLFDIEIVAETYTRGATFFPTEKTVRPISQGKALLVYGPRGYLAQLQKLGFQTWHTLWDESYDQLQGAERWDAMKQSMQKIKHTEVIESIAQIGQYNQQVLQDLITKYQPQ
jgi:hypothetical protein